MRFTSICSAALLSLSACSDDDYDYEGEGPLPSGPIGTLEVSWSIDGRTDEEMCEQVGAVGFRMNVFDEGYFVGDLDVPCADFSAGAELYVDDYLTRSTLIDEDGFAVVHRVFEDFLEVAEGQVTRLSMDFPSTPALPTDPETQPDAGAPSADAGEEPPDEPLPDAGTPAAADAAPPDAGP